MPATKSLPSRRRHRNLRNEDPPAVNGGEKASALGHDGRGPNQQAATVAEYIASIAAELAGMAGTARLDMLTYFLNLARLEAEFHMRRRD